MRTPCHHGIAQFHKPWHIKRFRIQIREITLGRDMDALDQLAITQHINPVLAAIDVLHLRPTSKL